ncbi:MAG: BspA family leucine-rich repeat surface protein, partial [Candidatus Nanopelagicales bacterium]
GGGGRGIAGVGGSGGGVGGSSEAGTWNGGGGGGGSTAISGTGVEIVAGGGGGGGAATQDPATTTAAKSGRTGGNAGGSDGAGNNGTGNATAAGVGGANGTGGAKPTAPGTQTAGADGVTGGGGAGSGATSNASSGGGAGGAGYGGGSGGTLFQGGNGGGAGGSKGSTGAYSTTYSGSSAGGTAGPKPGGTGGVGTNGSVSFTAMPSAPTIGSITASSRQLTVAFTAGADNGQTVTNFQYSTDGGTTWRDRTDSGTTASPLTITKLSTDGTTDLVNGTAYAVQVRAYVSATAIGSASTSVSATPNPTQEVTFTSSAPSSAEVGGATYLVTGTASSGLTPVFTVDASASAVCSIDGSNVVSFVGAGTCVINGNQAGDSSWAAAPQVQQTFAVAGVPGVPTMLAPSPGNSSATVFWNVPVSDGGSAITGYKIEQCDESGILCSIVNADTGSAATSYTVSGLVNDTQYTFKVSAINDVGISDVSAISNEVTPSASVFVSTWKTDNDGSAADTVVLPLADGTFGGVTNSYNFTAYWGDGSSSAVTNAAGGTHTYTTAGTYTVTIVGTMKGFRFGTIDEGGDRLKLLDVSNWGSLNFGNGGDYFYGAANFNATATDAPDLTGTTSLARTFREATSFNANISNWNTLAVTDVAEMFDAYDVEAPSSFNQPLTTTDGGWNTSNMTDMGNMFRKASAFTGDGLSTWDTSSAQRMNAMFRDASSFNADLSGWDTADVTVMGYMFGGATQFNADLGDWDTGSVTELANMFRGATAFNADISGWDTSSATDMDHMFDGASTFNQDLGQWNIGALHSDGEQHFGAENMLNGTALSTANFDSLLVGWAGQATVPSGITLGAGATTYSAGAPTTAHGVLTDTHGWSISDGGQSAVPGAPTNVAGTGANNRITATWDPAAAPSGSPVTSYTATVSPGGQSCTTPDGSTLTCAITGLTNGATYTITVAAINVGGPGLNSDASAPVVANAELPVNTATPAVSGTTTVGQQLSSTTGSWDSDPTATYAYEWQRCAAVDCASPTVVGSDSSNYTLVAADYGNYIRVKVTATNSGGSASAYSSATAQVAGTAPVNSVAPAVSGTPTVRSSVSVTTGTWSGTPTPTYSYQWRTCTTPDCSGGTVTNVDGATSDSYTIQNAQNALYLQAVVTATNAISPSGVTQASSVTAAVARPSQTFSEDGTYTVPSGVTSVSVTVAGAGGGNYVANTGNATGGSGASVSGTLSVTPGDTLTIQTGGLGGNNTGNAGGAGGTRGGGAGANGLWT